MAVSVNVVSKALDGDLWKVRVEFNDGSYNALLVRDDADLVRQILAVEAAKSRTVTLGKRDIEQPKPPEPPVPTMDEIDLAAFASLVGEYERMAAEVKAGVGKTTQADVDAKVAEIKAAYKDEYAPMIVGVF